MRTHDILEEVSSTNRGWVPEPMGASLCTGWDAAYCSAAPHQPRVCIVFIHSFPPHPWQPPRSSVNTHCSKSSQNNVAYGRPEWTAKCSINQCCRNRTNAEFCHQVCNAVLSTIPMLEKKRKPKTNNDWIVHHWSKIHLRKIWGKVIN